MQPEPLSNALAPRIMEPAAALASTPSPSGFKADKARFLRDWFIAHCRLIPFLYDIGNVSPRRKGAPGNVA